MKENSINLFFNDKGICNAVVYPNGVRRNFDDGHPIFNNMSIDVVIEHTDKYIIMTNKATGYCEYLDKNTYNLMRVYKPNNIVAHYNDKGHCIYEKFSNGDEWWYYGNKRGTVRCVRFTNGYKNKKYENGECKYFKSSRLSGPVIEKWYDTAGRVRHIYFNNKHTYYDKNSNVRYSKELNSDSNITTEQWYDTNGNVTRTLHTSVMPEFDKMTKNSIYHSPNTIDDAYDSFRQTVMQHKKPVKVTCIKRRKHKNAVYVIPSPMCELDKNTLTSVIKKFMDELDKK